MSGFPVHCKIVAPTGHVYEQRIRLPFPPFPGLACQLDNVPFPGVGRVFRIEAVTYVVSSGFFVCTCQLLKVAVITHDELVAAGWELE